MRSLFRFKKALFVFLKIMSLAHCFFFGKQCRVAETDDGLSRYAQASTLAKGKGLPKFTLRDMDFRLGDKDPTAGIQIGLQLAEKSLWIVDLVHHPKA